MHVPFSARCKISHGSSIPRAILKQTSYRAYRVRDIDKGARSSGGRSHSLSLSLSIFLLLSYARPQDDYTKKRAKGRAYTGDGCL